MINIQSLPKQTIELIEVIGLDAVLDLIKVRRGTTIWVPCQADPEHWLVAIVGLDAFQKLVQRYAYTSLNIDSCTKAIKEARNISICNDSERLSHWELAIKYRLNQRSVRRILRSCRKGGIPPHGAEVADGDIFDFG